jgi:hypothetical protein
MEDRGEGEDEPEHEGDPPPAHRRPVSAPRAESARGVRVAPGPTEARAPPVEHQPEQDERVDQRPHALVVQAREGGAELEAEPAHADHPQDHRGAQRAVEAVEGVGEQVPPDPGQGAVAEGLQPPGARLPQGVVRVRRGLVDDLGEHLRVDRAEGDGQGEHADERVAAQHQQQPDRPHRLVDAARDPEGEPHPEHPSSAAAGGDRGAAPPGLAHHRPSHEADQGREHRAEQGEGDGGRGGVEGAQEEVRREIGVQGRHGESLQRGQTSRVPHLLAAEPHAPPGPQDRDRREDPPPARGPRAAGPCAHVPSR